MILSDLRRYLEQRGRVALSELAIHFDSDPGALRGMLEQWMRKGKVRRVSVSPACGEGCTKCAPEAVEIYEWVAEADTSEQAPTRCGECRSG